MHILYMSLCFIIIYQRKNVDEIYDVIFVRLLYLTEKKITSERKKILSAVGL